MKALTSPTLSSSSTSSTTINDDSIEPRITIKTVETENQKLLYAQQIIRELILSGKREEKDVAAKLKQSFDKTFGGTWHCIVGTSFGANLTHLENSFLYFYVENFAVMIFKCV
uniref:Dynein light chain n=1 Tax=Panagrolaimus sp. ES5 TaxID=591445 RepID=A0AC34F0Z0_9BILA